MGIYIRKEPAKYWLVESHREGGKVVQKLLKYLGTSPPTPEEFAHLQEEYKDKIPPLKQPHKKREEKK